MMMRLDPPIPLETPKGPGQCHILINEGCEQDLFWVVFIDGTGECWTFRNQEIRAQKNITLGRTAVTPITPAPGTAHAAP